MTVLFATVGVAVIAGIIVLARGRRGISVREGDPAHEKTSQWPGVVGGLLAFAMIAGAVYAMTVI